jgi:enterochelin esterase family protein
MRTTASRLLSLFSRGARNGWFAAVVLWLSPTHVSAQWPAPLQSPEVHADRRVTFRFFAPNAKKVLLYSDMGTPVSTMAEKQGVWSVTTDPLESDLYFYWFTMDDGFPLLDPSNSQVKPALQYPWSILHVPGPDSLLWEINDVPHGTVHRHFYRSKIAGDDRDFYVYTPPGYDSTDSARYPILYLLHGFNDVSASWTTVGRANVILDNLIARGKATPMIVVMPLAYGRPASEAAAWLNEVKRDIWINGTSVKEQKEEWLRIITGSREVFQSELMPRVEGLYRIDPARDAHAISGLSAGGTQSLHIGLDRPDYFGWVGAFSSAAVPNKDGSFGVDLPTPRERTNAPFRLVWLSCGKEDVFLEQNRELDRLLNSKGVQHDYIEVPGNHTYAVFRRNLAEFATLLFHNSASKR